MEYKLPNALLAGISQGEFCYGVSQHMTETMTAENLAAHGAAVILEHLMGRTPSVEKRGDGLYVLWGPFTFELPPANSMSCLTDDPGSFLDLNPPKVAPENL